VSAAHANDGGGSIRIPASHCGLVGLKPSRARVTLAPDFGDVLLGLVSELAVTRSVRDAARILDAVHGPAPGDPYAAPPPARSYLEEVGADPGALRIGLMTTPPGGQFETHPECVAAAESAATLLEALGHHVERSYPAALDDPSYIENFLIRWTSGVDWNLRYWGRAIGRELGPDDVEPCTWALAEQGRTHTGGSLLAAHEEAQAGARRIASWWADDGFDLLLTPTCAEPPPRLGEHDSPTDNPLMPIVRATPFAIFTAGFNTTGQPAISLPLHQSADGLPIGAQLVAAYGREDLLLRVAAQIEEAQPWADRTPPVHADRAASTA
jgi:amidase